MPVSQSSISIDRQGSKRSSRKKNRHSIENSSASGTVVEQSKLKSPERQYFEPFSSLTGRLSFYALDYFDTPYCPILAQFVFSIVNCTK